MDFGIFLVFIGGGFFQSFGWWNAIRGMINKSHINQKLYPKHYITPSRTIKKLFLIKKDKIPKYLYFMCYAPIFYFFLGPIEYILFYCANDRGTLAVSMLFVQYSVILFNAVIFLILSVVYKKR